MAAALRAALEGLAQVHAGVEAGHLLGVAVERQRRAASDLADPSLRRLAPARMVDRRVHVRVEAVLAGAPRFHVVGGWASTRLMCTIDLMPLNPYFHGTTRRSGAPFWFGSAFP